MRAFIIAAQSGETRRLKMYSVKLSARTGRGGLESVISRERERTSGTPADGLYYGTDRPLAVGARLSADPALHVEASAALDAVRPAAVRPRVGALPVATNIRDATVMAAMRLDGEAETQAARPVRIYKVHAQPFHTGPLAVVAEVARRLRAKLSVETLLGEYWRPSGLWHLREVLVPSLVVVEEVQPVSDRDAYIPRWVLSQEDERRARGL